MGWSTTRNDHTSTRPQIGQYRQYRPDFYLLIIKTYLEHYALDKNGNPPAIFGERYSESLRWKEQLHAENGTSLMTTTFADFVSGELFPKAEDGASSKQRQLTQEFRYAAEVNPSLNYVVGLFGFRQTIDSTGKQEQGAAAARFLLAPNALSATPGLLEGYGQTSDIQADNVSAAAFGQLEWQVTERLRLLPGLRFNYDDKHVDFDTQVYGGLQTSDPALIALQRSVLAPQSYSAGADDTNLSGQLTAAFRGGHPREHVRHLRHQLQVHRAEPVGRAH